MVERISIFKSTTDALCMPLRDWSESQIAISSIEGLAPVSATINITQYASADGGIFNSSRREQRNIVITGKLGDNPSMDAVREKVYDMVPVGDHVIVLLHFTDGTTKKINGYVESVESDYFGDLEGIQISIICPNPDFTIVDKYIANKFGSRDESNNIVPISSELPPWDYGMSTAYKEICIVSFVSNSINDDVIKTFDNLMVLAGDRIEFPNTDVETPYGLVGWYSDAAMENKINDISSIRTYNSVTYYAKYAEQYQLTIIVYDSTEYSTLTLLTYVAGDTIQFPGPNLNAYAGYEDYVVIGWYKDEICTIENDITIMPANNLTLYAKIEKSSEGAT